MAQHTRPEILRHINSTLSAELPTCHLCSWVWRPGDGLLPSAFVIKRPSGNCLVPDPATGRPHRSLLDAIPSPALVTWFQAS
jgi:hypothetical protein